MAGSTVHADVGPGDGGYRFPDVTEIESPSIHTHPRPQQTVQYPENIVQSGDKLLVAITEQPKPSRGTRQKVAAGQKSKRAV